MVVTIAFAACGDEAIHLRSVDGGGEGGAPRHSPDAGPSGGGGGGAGASVGGGGGDASGGGGADAPRACGDLPERDLHSIDEVKAALRASPAFPFPGGWRACTGTIVLCPSTSPDLSFDLAFTTLECGLNFESGFHTHLSLPMTIADTGQKTQTGAPVFELQITADTGVRHYPLAAQGHLGGEVGLRLLEADAPSPWWVALEPEIPLP